jgi:ribose 1,5-bisphosphokinase PhnN
VLPLEAGAVPLPAGHRAQCAQAKLRASALTSNVQKIDMPAYARRARRRGRGCHSQLLAEKPALLLIRARM